MFRDPKYEDTISTCKFVQSQPTGSQESILIFRCCTLALLQNPWQTPVTGHSWKQAGGPIVLSYNALGGLVFNFHITQLLTSKRQFLSLL